MKMGNLVQKIGKGLKKLGIGLVALTSLGIVTYGAIAIYNRNFANPRRLTPRDIFAKEWEPPRRSPSWSRDGKIAYWAGYNLVVKSNVKGGTTVGSITPKLYFYTYSQQPCWSPDGSKIAYRGLGLGEEDFVLEIGIISLTPNKRMIDSLESTIEYPPHSYIMEALDDCLAWSLDGEYIAFRYPKPDEEGNKENLWAIRIKDKSLRRLTNSESIDIHPSFSPDSKAIAFSSNRAGNYDIWIKYLEDNREFQLTKDEADDTQPDWSPDGKYIVFTSNRDGNKELYLTNPEGSIEERITCNKADDELASWSPDSKRIAFNSNRGISVYKVWTCRGIGWRVSKKPDIWIYNLEGILKKLEKRK